LQSKDERPKWPAARAKSRRQSSARRYHAYEGLKGTHILPSVISLDTTDHTAVLTIHRGEHNGVAVWYIVTDASNATVAHAMRAIYSPSLASIGAAATASASLKHGVPQLAGAPDFSPTRSYVPSASGFPPTSAHPGSVADASYSPFVQIAGTPGILNAPIVAVGEGPFDVTHHTNTEDRVLAIDTVKRTATFVLARGFFTTFVPRLARAAASATIPLGVVVNGALHGANAQGLAYLSLRTPLGTDATRANAGTIGSPFKVLSEIPDVAHPSRDGGYSPLWAIAVLGQASKWITSYAGFVVGSKPAGFLVNCPVIAFGDSGGY
jgi:hypothetical protein